ncbi:trypsin-like serine protease [Streptacidiphilus sp. ASG 303]|uniref:trypsin-like serine protease n=1 Tax=Streptacidiphilus sp. ASG 303 TaxID=2896847 RepID=UPI001E635D3C|nr:trypsin-like serine protease [Streptacidiphilus sp. ASG 303]MCD0482944.1 trypsin-like serine protease [Streptacidiphilus sp. ASG 303]
MNPAQRGSGMRRTRRNRLATVALATTLATGGVAAVSDAWAGTTLPADASTTGTLGTPAKAGQSRTDGSSLAARLRAAARKGVVGSGRPGAPKLPTGGISRIIGGTPISIGSAPSMVQLWYLLDDGTAMFCGGTLVAPDKVLTAAHCVAGLDWKSNGLVFYGTSTLADPNATPVGVWRQWSHPSFHGNTQDDLGNDVAVLTLDQPVRMPTTKLVAAGDTASYAPGTTGTVYGWGLTTGADDPNADLSPQLRRATLPVVSDSACATAMNSLPDTKGYFAAGKMFCAGKPASGTTAGTLSSCHGDSGGPLVVNGRIAGIVSWGAPDCVEKGGYSVFTKLSAYTATALERITDTDFTGDGKADLLVRTSSGQGYVYEGATMRYRASTGTGWNSFNKVLQTDLDRDGVNDLIERGTNGSLYREYWTGSDWTVARLATGWGTVRQIVTPGDLTGDYLPDLLTVDSAGKVWVYPGKGNGSFGSRFQVGSGLQGLSQLVGHGDFTGDGKADLVGRTSAGALYLWPGAGNGKFGARRTLSSSGFKSANALAAVGDVNNDGHADLLIRFTSGYLYLYPGKGNGYFGAKIQMGTGSFGSYTLLG